MAGDDVEQLDLDAVATFVAVLEERHYGRAATRMHLTQSAVTRRLHRLERQLGTQLLVRDGSGVSGPTSAGLRFATEARALLQQAYIARQAARHLPESHTVRLGVPGALGDYPTAAQLRALARTMHSECPHVRLRVVGVPLRELDNCLYDHQVDVLWTTALHHENESLSYTDLTVVRRVGLVGSRHELADTEMVDGQTFAAYPMFCDVTAPAAWMSIWLLNDLRPLGEAQLVEIDPFSRKSSLYAHIGSGQTVTAVHAPIADRLPQSLHAVQLTGVPAIRYVAARRRTDHRESVEALVRAMHAIASSI